MSGPIFAVAHVASTNGSAGSGRSVVLLHGLEHRRRGGALQRPAAPGARRPPATSGPPRPASAAGDVNSRPRQNLSRTYGIGRSTLALSRGLIAPGRVDQAAVMRGQLRIGPVQLRIVKIGLVHPGLQVVRHQPGRARRRRTRTPRRGTRSRPAGPSSAPAARTCAASTPAPSRTPRRCAASRSPDPATGPAARSRSAPAPRPQPGTGSTPSPATGGSPPGRWPPHSGGSSPRWPPGPARPAAAGGSSTSAPRP